MGGTSDHDMLVVEQDVMGEWSTLSLADQLAVKYGMKPMTEEYADKKMVKDFSNRELWEKCFLSPLVSQDHI